MKVINVRNVNDALDKGIQLFLDKGKLIGSRNGRTLEIEYPVSTVYKKPYEKVLLNPVRDANPFFHLMESLWILKGRNDVKFLSEFNKRIKDYSDDGITFNAAYGFRIGYQLTHIINILRNDPNSRQAVCQIWNQNDLLKTTKDKACNLCIVFRIRGDHLYMTVYNRSNDMIWGTYGANAVQFSMIQEYVAAHLNLQIGSYTQVSNSYHVYLDGPGGVIWDKLKKDYRQRVKKTTNLSYINYNDITPILMTNVEISKIDNDINIFFELYDSCSDPYEITRIGGLGSYYFNRLILPMLRTYHRYKNEGPEAAKLTSQDILSEDWRLACQYWLDNRIKGKTS